MPCLSKTSIRGNTVHLRFLLPEPILYGIDPRTSTSNEHEILVGTLRSEKRIPPHFSKSETAELIKIVLHEHLGTPLTRTLWRSCSFLEFQRGENFALKRIAMELAEGEGERGDLFDKMESVGNAESDRYHFGYHIKC